MKTKIRGFQNPKPRIKNSSAAATRPSTPLSLSARLVRPDPRRQRIGFASLRALDGSGVEPEDSLFMKGKGGTATRGKMPSNSGCRKERLRNPLADSYRRFRLKR